MVEFRYGSRLNLISLEGRIFMAVRSKELKRWIMFVASYLEIFSTDFLRKIQENGWYVKSEWCFQGRKSKAESGRKKNKLEYGQKLEGWWTERFFGGVEGWRRVRRAVEKRRWRRNRIFLDSKWRLYYCTYILLGRTSRSVRGCSRNGLTDGYTLFQS